METPCRLCKDTLWEVSVNQLCDSDDNFLNDDGKYQDLCLLYD
jgi:hypothetical protein